MEILHQDYTIEIDSIQQPEWSELLDQFDDATFYQTWGYGVLHHGSRQLTHFVVKRDNQLVGAAQGRIVRIPGLRIGIAHFPWGPMWRVRGTQMDTDSLQHTLRLLFNHYAVHRGLLVRIRSCEINSEHNERAVFPLFEEQGFNHSVESHYETIRLNLTPPSAQLRNNMNSSWRRHLRAAEKKDLTIVQGDSDELFEKFSKLYDEMYARKKIVGYDPAIKKYREMQAKTPDHLKFTIMICEFENEPIAANVISAMGNTGMYFFGATSERAIRENLRGAYLLHWRTIEWLKNQGYSWYDLRGYDPKAYPGVSRFKAGVNGDTVGFAEFTGCANPVSLAAVRLGEGSFRRLRAALGRNSYE
jgi:lipid II:glycine glycyltransferase (peptidoglycan interpeptide bridge formation enzyme)